MSEEKRVMLSGITPFCFIVKPVITYTLKEGRGYNPRQRGWGVCSLTNCKHIFGFYYKGNVLRGIPFSRLDK